jgi:hypothetical protein
MPHWLLKFLFLYILQSLESRWFSRVGQVRDHQLTVRTSHLYKQPTSKTACIATIGYYRQWTMPAHIHIKSQQLLKIFREPSVIPVQVLNSSTNYIHYTKQPSITKTEWGNQCHIYYWNGWAKNQSNILCWVDRASWIMYNNQLDALFILSLLNWDTSTCFGQAWVEWNSIGVPFHPGSLTVTLEVPFATYIHLTSWWWAVDARNM